MSRIGNQLLTIPSGTEVKFENNIFTVKSKNGELSQKISDVLTVEINENTIKINRNSEEKSVKSLHGTTTSLIKNMIIGLNEGYKKELELNGVGYRVAIQGNKVNLSLGFSHPTVVEAPVGIKVEAPSQTELIISGVDKQLVGEFAANIRKIRPPEPYKGKGVKYKEEIIRRKEGKRAGK